MTDHRADNHSESGGGAELWEGVRSLRWHRATVRWRGEQDKPMYGAVFDRPFEGSAQDPEPFVVTIPVTDEEARMIVSAVEQAGLTPSAAEGPEGPWYELTFEFDHSAVHLALVDETEALATFRRIQAALAEPGRIALRPFVDRYATMVRHREEPGDEE